MMKAPVRLKALPGNVASADAAMSDRLMMLRRFLAVHSDH
jgi:hypothetical protein